LIARIIIVMNSMMMIVQNDAQHQQGELPVVRKSHRQCKGRILVFAQHDRR